MRISIWIVVLAAGFGLGGCSNGSGGPGEAPAATPPESLEAADDPAGESGPKPVPADSGQHGLFSEEVPSYSLDSAGLEFQCGKGDAGDYQEIYPHNIIDVAESYYFQDLDGLLTRFHTVAFDKYSMALFIEAFKAYEGLDGVDNVLDLGTGTGALSFAALAHGANKAVGTELDPLALRNARFNAKQLGVADRFEERLVPFDDQGAYSIIGPNERFDLILSDPPQGNEGTRVRYFPEVEDDQDAEGARELFFTADVGYCFLISVFEGLDAHLSEDGRMLLAIKSPQGRKRVHKLCRDHGFRSRILIDGRDGQFQKDKRLIGDTERLPDLSLYASIIEVKRGSR